MCVLGRIPFWRGTRLMYSASPAKKQKNKLLKHTSSVPFLVYQRATITAITTTRTKNKIKQNKTRQQQKDRWFRSILKPDIEILLRSIQVSLNTPITSTYHLSTRHLYISVLTLICSYAVYPYCHNLAIFHLRVHKGQIFL